MLTAARMITFIYAWRTFAFQGFPVYLIKFSLVLSFKFDPFHLATRADTRFVMGAITQTTGGIGAL